jgi:NAD-dependent deacetylase
MNTNVKLVAIVLRRLFFQYTMLSRNAPSVIAVMFKNLSLPLRFAHQAYPKAPEDLLRQSASPPGEAFAPDFPVWKMTIMTDRLKEIVQGFLSTKSRITFLTGAGISAESNIPTFRGPEGYWSIGSKNYHPQEMATYRMFQDRPEEVWTWYLYRMGICKKAFPNPGHLALTALEKMFGDRFTLITQNVDNLHLCAGNSPTRTWQIHGNIFFMRCVSECRKRIYPLPNAINGKQKGDHLTEQDRRLLKCPDCSGPVRPHVLWFDESYNEHYYHLYSSLNAAGETGLLVVAGTSGATNLPNQIVSKVFHNAKPIIDINIEQSPFSVPAVKSDGIFMEETSTQGLNKLLETFRELL